MFDQSMDSLHVKKLAQIKVRNNQYLPNNNPSINTHKKLNKSKSQLLNLSNQVESNRKKLNSVNKALLKQRPVDYYEDGKYLYDREIENIQKLYLDNLKNKNEKLVKELNVMKKKMVKIRLYKFNRKKKEKNGEKENKENSKSEENEEEIKQEINIENKIEEKKEEKSLEKKEPI